MMSIVLILGCGVKWGTVSGGHPALTTKAMKENLVMREVGRVLHHTVGDLLIRYVADGSSNH